MSFEFRHKSSREKHIPWYGKKWAPFAFALIGAFIAAFTQISATILPIYYGPSSLCDFSISANPPAGSVTVLNGSTEIISTKINVTDLRPLIKPYEHQVYIKILGSLPPGVDVRLQNKVGLLPLNNLMRIYIDGKVCDSGYYEMTIQVVGGDGMRRNCTYFLSINKVIEMDNKSFQTYSGSRGGKF